MLCLSVLCCVYMLRVHVACTCCVYMFVCTCLCVHVVCTCCVYMLCVHVCSTASRIIIIQQQLQQQILGSPWVKLSSRTLFQNTSSSLFSFFFRSPLFAHTKHPDNLSAAAAVEAQASAEAAAASASAAAEFEAVAAAEEELAEQAEAKAEEAESVAKAAAAALTAARIEAEETQKGTGGVREVPFVVVVCCCRLLLSLVFVVFIASSAGS